MLVRGLGRGTRVRETLDLRGEKSQSTVLACMGWNVLLLILDLWFSAWWVCMGRVPWIALPWCFEYHGGELSIMTIDVKRLVSPALICTPFLGCRFSLESVVELFAPPFHYELVYERTISFQAPVGKPQSCHLHRVQSLRISNAN